MIGCNCQAEVELRLVPKDDWNLERYEFIDQKDGQINKFQLSERNVTIKACLRITGRGTEIRNS